MKRRPSSDGADSTPRLGGVLEFMRILWALDHALQTRSRRMAVRSGVTGPQRLTLRIIGRYPGITAGRLAAVLHLHPSTLTEVLERLRRRGLIRRTPDPRDRRRAHFRLTDRGLRCDAARSGTVESAVRGALARLPESEISSARTVLTLLARDLLRAR